jgi:hypothetical protein
MKISELKKLANPYLLSYINKLEATIRKKNQKIKELEMDNYALGEAAEDAFND